MGITDIEDSFKRLNNLIEDEVRMAIAQTLRTTIEHKSGAQPIQPVTHLTPKHCPQIPRKPTREKKQTKLQTTKTKLGVRGLTLTSLLLAAR